MEYLRRCKELTNTLAKANADPGFAGNSRSGTTRNSATEAFQVSSPVKETGQSRSYPLLHTPYQSIITLSPPPNSAASDPTASLEPRPQIRPFLMLRLSLHIVRAHLFFP